MSIDNVKIFEWLKSKDYQTDCEETAGVITLYRHAHTSTLFNKPISL